ncbi:hypothetical protein, partial [Streptococcus anginosus]|uniref:hypothetical protein n=1 Tax=Streptococcus anginosus TaxID=1328 RepID=UPI002ED915CE
MLSYFIFLTIILFVYISSDIPFLVTPPQPTYLILFSPLPFASMSVLLYPLTHSHHTTLASPHAGASSLH